MNELLKWKKVKHIMRTLNITILFLSIIHFCFGQKLEILSYQAPEDLTKLIQLNDSLLSKYQKKPFYLITSSDSISNKSKTLRHFWDFYRSERVFQKDSIHAKKQLKVIKVTVDEEIKYELKNEKRKVSYDSQLRKILVATKNKFEKNEIEKALELYQRYLILKPKD